MDRLGYLNPAYPSSTVRDYVTLLKPGVMSLVVFTGFTGMMLAPGHLHPLLQLVTLLCIALGSGAGGVINMWFDRDIDVFMARTAARPLPAGRIHPDDALAFGLFLSMSSVGLLGIAVNWLAASYLAGAIAFYVFIYTVWLKRRTPQNIVIGGAAGAFPPIIGWAAVTGDTSLMPWILFLIIFLWTPPHFWALALYRNQDYKRAGIPMLPVVAGPAVTKIHMLCYTWALAALCMVPVAIGESGAFYAIASVVLNAKFIHHAVRVKRSQDDTVARAMFGYSIFYLFALYLAFLGDKLIDKLSFFSSF